jgi:FtsH-binding integral membrane protein
MSYADEMYAQDQFVIDAAQDERVAFIRRVYAHVGAATLLFVGLVAGFINTPAIAEPLMRFFFAMPWAILIALMVAGWVAHRMAAAHASPGLQYAGLGLYAVAEALFFTPLLYLLHTWQAGGDQIILQAGILTLFIFGGLTACVLLTKADFSFLRNFLIVGMLAAFGLMILSFFTTIVLGTWFVVGMIVLMSGFILYETSNVLHHYHTSQHVAAALAIFSSLTTLFWYVLQLMSILGDD